jgi:hypothetical protein
MKTSKKIRLGLSAFLSIGLFLLLFLPGSTALAAGSTSANDVLNCTKNLHFVNISEIACTFTPDGQSNQTTVRFIDSLPTDGGSTRAYKQNYAQQGNFFCESGGVTTSTNKGGAFDRYYALGVTHKGDSPLKVTDAGSDIKLVFNEGFSDASTGQCSYPKGYNKDKLPNVTISGGKTQNISKVLQFSDSGDGLVPFDGVDQGDLSNTYDLVGQYTYNDSTIAFTRDFVPGTCSGEVVLVNTSGGSANRFVLNSDDKSLEDHPVLLDFLNKQSTSGCYINEGDTNYGLGGSFKVAGTPPAKSIINQAAAAGANNTIGSDGFNSNSNCAESSGGFALTWVVCPVLDASSALANEFIHLFEDHLAPRTATAPLRPAGRSYETWLRL